MADFARFENAVELEIATPRPAAMLNALKGAGLRLEGLRPEAHSVSFTLPASEMKRLRKILRGLQGHVRIVRKKGPRQMRRRAGRRWGFFGGAVMAALLLLTVSQMIWQVRVKAGEGFDADEVRHRVEQLGYAPGTFWMQADLDALCERLRLEYPEMSFVEAGREGVTLTVEMVPRTEGEPIFDRSAPRHIVATYDAIVRQVVTLAGRAVVQPGDAVTAGQVLIEGWGVAADGSEKALHAQGFVQGEVTLQGEGVSPLVQTVETPTGRTSEQRYIAVLGFALWQSEMIPFSSFGTLVQPTPLLGQLYLPVQSVRCVHYETTWRDVSRDEGEARKEALREALGRLRTLLPEDSILVDKTTEFCNMEGKEVGCAVRLVVMTQIGRERAFTPIG